MINIFNKNIKKIYLIGIKGTGMSSLAVMLKNLGYDVTGSDTKERFFTENQLKNNDIKYFEGFNKKNIQKNKIDAIITSTAHGINNPEVKAAKKLKLESISFPKAVGYISKKFNSIAVCGSHGKTTTSSILSSIMQTNSQTAFLVGTVANLPGIKNNVKFFVFEADEYENKLKYFYPNSVILTNIDFDHPDFFKTKNQYFKTFKTFLDRILKNKKLVIYNYDDKNSRKILSRNKSGNIISFGFNKKSYYQIKNMHPDLNKFEIFNKNKKILNVNLSIYGKHNILNATAAAIMALNYGLKKKTIEKELLKFKGTQRRMEYIPSKKYTIIDDYGHHPTEILATLNAIRNKYKKNKIITVFHPHTFTRTESLLKEFGKSFKNSDLTIVLDIYSSAREKASGIHSKDLVNEIKDNKSEAIYQATIANAAKYINKNIKKGSIVLTIGAGDVWKLCDLIK